jgi:hypothetical protein
MDRAVFGFGLSYPIASRACRGWLFALGLGAATALSAVPAQAQMCGGTAYPFPYTDVGAVGSPFCLGILEAFVTGVTNGTAPGTFSPNENVTRVQMTTFLQRSFEQGLRRDSRRGALNQWWTTRYPAPSQAIAVAGDPIFCAADGQNIWVSTFGTVVQLDASTGKTLGTWTGATDGYGIVVAVGRIFVASDDSPGILYVVDPTAKPGAVTVAPSVLGNQPKGIAFDGVNLWTANNGGSVSIISPTPPYEATTVPGFSVPAGVLFDGSNIWITDYAAGTLLKLDVNGAVLQTVTVGVGPQYPVFDGANIWVPLQNTNSITVVQASTGNIVATISADASNLLNQPLAATFDGEHILVTNLGGESVSIFRAVDLSFIVNVATASADPVGACSDGINLWVADQASGMVRY